LLELATCNNVVIAVFSSLRWIFDGRRIGVTYPARWRHSMVGYYSELTDALASHDAESAAKVTAAAIENWRHHLEKHQPEALDQPILWETNGT
jgi:DNA-binding GntR family transcriptional regulator